MSETKDSKAEQPKVPHLHVDREVLRQQIESVPDVPTEAGIGKAEQPTAGEPNFCGECGCTRQNGHYAHCKHAKAEVESLRSQLRDKEEELAKVYEHIAKVREIAVKAYYGKMGEDIRVEYEEALVGLEKIDDMTAPSTLATLRSKQTVEQEER